MDLFSRKIVSWKLNFSMKASIVCDSLESAFLLRGKPNNLIFHSDQGSQYTCSEFRNLLDKFNITASFSKKGYPYDNAVCESFFKFLKKECTNRRSYSTFDELRIDLFEYIEGFYNIRRPHSANNFLSPCEREDLYMKNLNSIP